ncbi:MAG: PEGA domain-containing protein [Candidatus Cloacimonetes bacterium]|jgi:hypothetical protein|nr:PEGA domain-containing protein [Candidatus Cloacimonadota bacterium]
MSVFKLVLIWVFIGILFILNGCNNAVEPDEYATLVVNSTPEGAFIILDGDSTGYVTPANLEIDPGDHICKLMLNGYNDYIVSFSIEKGDTYTINAILDDTIILIVNSTPEGATIILDGNNTGYVTPDTLEINPGNHELRLELTGYQDYIENFSIEAGNTYTVNANLIENATLIANSTPEGATIILDGNNTGSLTPATLEIVPGEYELRLELVGYQSYVGTFYINGGDTYSVNVILEEIINTSLQINSVPSGASIYIDGAYTGYFTPVTFTDILPGYHYFRIYKPGYNEIVHYVNIVENVPYTITEVLEYPVPPYPVFDISYPYDGEHFTDNVIGIEGNVELDTGDPYTGDSAILSINGVDSEIYVSYGYFDETISIAAGENELQMRANGPEGDTGVSDIITVYGDFTAPEIEVVLWWNTPTADIDLHAWNPAGEWCYYGNPVISDGFLDIDDIEGYGPETFAVQTANVGVYDIQINCFSLDSDNYSDASVQVFFDGVLMANYGPHHFIVDDGNGTDPAAWWEVCTITVENGRCVITNDKPTPEVREKIKLDKINLPEK